MSGRQSGETAEAAPRLLIGGADAPRELPVGGAPSGLPVMTPHGARASAEAIAESGFHP